MRLSVCLIAAAIIATLAGASVAEARNRTLDLYFTHTKERAKITYKRNGQFVRSGVRDLNRFLRDWRRNESTRMDPELFDLLWEVQQEFGGKTIHIVSAYRSPATNSMLRRRSRGVARNSQHMAGKAIDFFIPGAKISKVRTAGMKRQVGGVGYYPRSGSPFVHFDTGRVRSWPRMSRGQLARLFPDGKTLHLPSNGKPLKGYAAAQKAEKAGKLASLGRSTSSGLGLGRLFRGNNNDPDEPVRVQTASLGPAARTTPRPAQRSTPPAAPRQATAASSAAAEPGNEGGLFRQLPSVSLGGLIGRFRGDEEREPAEVTPVAPPQTPLTAVATEPAPANAVAAGPAPIPRAAPRVPAAVAADRPATPDAPVDDNPIVLAALPNPRGPGADPQSDVAATALGYAPSDDDATPRSALGAAAAIIPRTATTLPAPGGRQSPSARTVPIVEASLSPVRGASPILIANPSGIEDREFSDFTAPDRFAASRGGLLMADGFLGTPRGFASSTEWPETSRFTGLKITVFASPRS